MAKVYRYNQVVTQTQLNQLLAARGDYGSRFNPIKDITGFYCISEEEWDAAEFQKFKGTLLDSTKVTLVDYVPVPSTRIKPGDP